MKRLLILCLAIALVAGTGVSAIVMGTSNTSRTLSAADMESSGQRWFIKFDGVDGEWKEVDHRNWSELVSFGQLIGQQDGSSAGATGRSRGGVIAEDIEVTKVLDKASPRFAEAALKGKVYPKVDIHVTREQGGAGLMVYYAYELKNVRITRYQVGGANNGGFLTEEMSLSFEEIKVTYTEFDATGNEMGRYEYTWKAGQARV